MMIRQVHTFLLVLWLVFLPCVITAQPLAQGLPSLPRFPWHLNERMKPKRQQQVLPPPPSLHCQNVWAGPSPKNSIKDCIMDVKRLKANWTPLLLTALNAVLLLVTMCSFPTVFFCVACCDCRKNCIPRTRPQSTRSRCCLWLWIIYALLWCALAIATIFVGMNMLTTAAPELIDNTVFGPLHYFHDTAERIVDLTSDWSSGTREPLRGVTLDLTAFINVSKKINFFLGEVRSIHLLHLKLTSLVSYGVSGVVIGMILLVVLTACVRCCIPCIPLCFSCACCAMTTVFAFLAVILNLVAYLTVVGCGEVELQHNRLPGLFQWYVVPTCKQHFGFTALCNEVNETEARLSQDACKELLFFCDNDETQSRVQNAEPLTTTKAASTLLSLIQASPFSSEKSEASIHSGVTPVRPFLCGNNIKSSLDCLDFNAVASVLFNTTVKRSLNVCPETDATCTLTECAEGCRNSDIKSQAGHIMELAALANNASIALSYAVPLLDCNFLVDKLADSVKNCGALETSFFLLGFGFCVGGLMFGLAIYVALRGSCIWGGLSLQHNDRDCDEYTQ